MNLIRLSDPFYARARLWLTPHVVVSCAILFLVANKAGSAEVRLIDQEPYDLIRLDAANGNRTFKVFPLDLPQRQLPSNPPASATLRIRLLDLPHRQYDVQWQYIAEVKLFEQLVLEEAEKLVAETKFGQAYEHYNYVFKVHPNLPGLDAAIDDYYLKSAIFLYREGQFDAALARLIELDGRNPNHPALPNAMSRVGERLINKWVQEKNYSAARGILTLLKQKLPENEQAVTRQWEEQFTNQASQLLAAAKSHFAAVRYRDALNACRQALTIWPSLPGTRELAEEINLKYPLVVVGVTLPIGLPSSNRLDDWASRRRGRLMNRALMELVGFGAQGGNYLCPLGDFSQDDAGRELTIQLRGGIPWSIGGGSITGYDVSRRLLERADPTQEAYDADWSQRLEGVSVDKIYRVVAEMRQPHVRPEAFLQAGLSENGSAAGAGEGGQSYGPYVIRSHSAVEVRYLGAAEYDLAVATQPKEIVERLFQDSGEAVKSLRNGDIAVLDRVSPWDADALINVPDLVVERYAIPTVHVLIPNHRKPLMGNRTFRRALVYGIHRELILQQELLAGANLTGSAVVSGPFPMRSSFDDPIGYAYDDQIEPRPYEPRLALTLAAAALKELSAGEKDRSAAPPMVVLAHPPEPVARLACQSIKRHLERVGISVDLKEGDLGDPSKFGDDYDLLYAQLAMWEPVVDARRLLGADGLVGNSSPYVNLALRQLSEAQDWNQVRDRLHEIHRLVHDDVSVIPLWQLVEHFAYHRGLSGIGERPTVLYQNVEQWQITTPLHSER